MYTNLYIYIYTILYIITIMHSGNTDKSEIDVFIAQGADRVFTKPLSERDIQILLHTLQNLK